MRHFLLLMFVLFASFAFAQEVRIDRIEDDGTRQIMTSSKNFVIDNESFSICLKLYESDYPYEYIFLISSYKSIPEQSEVLIKLGNDEIINLPCNNVHEGSVTAGGYALTYGNFTSISPAREVSYYSAVFVLDAYELDKIEEYGIKKIRIFNGIQTLDKEFKKNQLGKFLIKSRKLILERLKNKPTQHNPYEGF